MAHKKKNYLPRVRKVRVPDQDGYLPYAITFDHYIVGNTGKRDQFVIRKEVKFHKSEDMADYYEQNCHQSKLRDFRPDRENKESENVSAG